MASSAPALGEEVVAPDEAAVTSAFIAFLTEASRARYPKGRIARFNQARAAGCVDAELTVLADLPEELRVGLFAAPRRYRAWVRFASASSTSDRQEDVRGMSLRVFGVEGDNLTPGATVQDFLLNSHPVMMAPDARGFLELLRANEAGGLQRALYFLTHPKATRIAIASRQHHTCHLDIPYWSTTPYRFGAGRAVKYKAAPVSGVRSKLPSSLTDSYLASELRNRLRAGDATFELMVQLQTDSVRMPIEDASVEWNEAASPYRAVARLHFPQQKIDGTDGVVRCEEAAFNPWNCLVEHRPLGSMNRARREIYSALSSLRAASR